MNVRTFETETDGQKLKLEVRKPTNANNREAQFIYSRSLKEALEKGVPARQSLEKILRKQNLWDDEKEKEYVDSQNKVAEVKDVLENKGGITLKRGKELAVEARIARWKLRLLNMDRNSMDANSAESIAEQDKFNYLVSVCTVYNDTGKAYFKNLEDYLAKSTEQVGYEAASAFGNLFYGVEEDYEKKLPENKFLLKYGFCNDDLSLVDKNGNLVNVRGARIDKEGFLINENEQRINEDGTLLVEKSEVFKPFLDDDGNEV